MKTCTSTKKVRAGIMAAAQDLREYWPLTLRQIYYWMVAALIIRNSMAEYRKTSRECVHLREEELLPWSAMIDPARRTTEKRGVQNVSVFLQEQFDDVFDPRYYKRCYVQKQSVYCEVLTEKDALSRIMEEEAYWFCTRLNVIRGQPSVTIVEQIATRLDNAINLGQTPILLHFGDFDPTGIAIPKTIQKNLLERHSIDCEVRVAALTLEQIQHYGLPQSPDGVKTKDSNYKAWLKEYGKDQAPTELDALSPKLIQQIMRDALSDIYDMTGYEKEKATEQLEREKLTEIRCDVQDFLLDRYPEYFNTGTVAS